MLRSERRSGFRVRAFMITWRRSRRAHNRSYARFVVPLCQNVVFYVLWVVEAVVVVAYLCFFFLRFGFSL
ncbi:hypothetical protein ACMD2_20838 [Ananas comosus]|uniref:Uncharacterized protein n=1 Tax=Ananas comosus TaxID=4615 RepID=A0A199VCS9_ANACO|nr:hypothetical protein ACMD2_20838 [Ananas comosus]